MKALVASLAFAIGSLMHRRMLWLMIWPVLISLGLWFGVMLVFWTRLVLWLAEVLKGWLANATFFVNWDASDAALLAAKVMTVIMLVPLVQLTALLILGVFGMQAMVEHVSESKFPDLERRRGGSFAGSIWNTVVAIAGLLVIGVLSLPAWLIPPLWPFIPVLIMGWVNQRVLRYDALAEHADAQEMKRIFSSRIAAMYALGMVLAVFSYVPLIGFFVPVIFGLAFIHFLLGELQATRLSPDPGP